MKNQVEVNFERLAKRIYGRHRRNAKSRNIDFTISLDQVSDLLIKCGLKCQVSGLYLSVDRDGVKYNQMNPLSPSIDRIDSRKGYIKGNIRIVACCVNMALGVWGDDMFHKMCMCYIKNYRGPHSVDSKLYLTYKDLKGRLPKLNKTQINTAIDLMLENKDKHYRSFVLSPTNQLLFTEFGVSYIEDLFKNESDNH